MSKPKKMALISLRLPEWLRLRIEEAAIAEETSMNSLINDRMAASFDQPALVDALAERFTQRVVGLVRDDIAGTKTRRHADTCDYHCDQYEFECSCGANAATGA